MGELVKTPYRTITVVAALDVMCAKDEAEAMDSVAGLIETQPDVSLKSITTGVHTLEWVLNAVGAKLDLSTGWIEIPGVGSLERGPDQRWKVVPIGE